MKAGVVKVAWAWCVLLVPLLAPTTHAQALDFNIEYLLEPPLLTRASSIHTPCQTPDKQAGVCGNAFLCEPYKALLNQVSTNQTVLLFFRERVCKQAQGLIHICCPIAPTLNGPPPTPGSPISFGQQSPPRGGFHRPSQRPNARQPAQGGFREDNEEEDDEEIEFANHPPQPTRFPQLVPKPLPPAGNSRPPTRFTTTTTTPATTTTTRQPVLFQPQQPPSSGGVFVGQDRAPVLPGVQDVSQNTEPSITEPPVPSILPTQLECGFTSPGGSATPWAVGVGSMDNGVFQVVCGGALISHLHVVIAAHCLHAPAPTHVRLGNLPEATEDLPILTWVHPDYHATSRDNDIALLTLASPASFSDYIRPVCLPFPYRLDGFVGQQVQVLGWGTGSTVKEGTVQVIGLGECRKAYNSPALISDNKVGFFADPTTTIGSPVFSPRTLSGAMVVDRRHLCGSPAPSAASATTCLSDFGAPLIYLDLDTTGKSFLVGVSSRGEGCDAGPGLYTRIGSFLPWLAAQLSTVKASTQTPASSPVPSPPLLRRVPEQTQRRSRG